MQELLNIIKDPSRVRIGGIEDKYLSDTLGRLKGTAAALVFPKSTEEVSAVMKYAYENGIPVTPRGAGTNLVGSTVPHGNGIILDFSLMNRVLEIDEDTFTAVVEPGVVLQDFQKLVESRGLFYPPDPGEKTATIGGNIGNASPKGDMPQPLILMDAEVVLTSVDGERRMLVDDYIIATKKTALREDEIITKVIIPKQDFTHTFFRKIGMRRANAISKLTLSAAATVRDGVLVDFRASSGAAGPKVARSRKAEELLIGKKVSELHTCKEEFLDAWNTVISPHAMPEYRRNTTRRMLAFFIDALEAGHAPGRVDIQE